MEARSVATCASAPVPAATPAARNAQAKKRRAGRCLLMAELRGRRREGGGSVAHLDHGRPACIRFPSTHSVELPVRIDVARDHEQRSRHAADRIAAAIRRKPALLLGTVTGASPTRTYERLAERRMVAPALFRRLRVLKLDEWLGLPPRHPSSCERYLRENLLTPLRIPRRRYQ